MNFKVTDLRRLVGVEAYLRIHDNMGPDVVLEKDPTDGYLYRGVFVGKVVFENGGTEEHFAISLTRPILYRSKECARHPMNQILATTRYKGDAMTDILGGRELTASFSSLLDLEFPGVSAANIKKYRKTVFQTDDFVWIGIGELSTKRPQRPYLEAPWDTAESPGRIRDCDA